MNVIDHCAHAGPWNHRAIGLDTRALAGSLEPFGVSRIFVGRLEALWYENPHDANRLTSSSRAGKVDVVDVPVLDPTFASWSEELDRLTKLGPPRRVRLFPNYHGYTLTEAGPLLAALEKRRIAAQVIVRMEDPRRQHRLAQVPDVPAASVHDAARRHPKLRILLSCAQQAALKALAGSLPGAGNLWADTSQIEGLEVMADLMKSPWRHRLVFGSHAPLFIPYAALARVVLDLDDPAVKLIFEENSRSLL